MDNDNKPINICLHKQLFLDDGCIQSMFDVKRRLHQPQKCGPVLRPDRAREQISLQSRSVPQWNAEKDVWEWWYWASYRVPPYGPYQSTAVSLVHYAVSPDGARWETPTLGLHEWRGSKQNNIAEDPQKGHRSIYHVIRDEPDPDPARRYKGLFGSEGRQPAVSHDGFNWTMLDVKPIPSSDESHFTYDESSGQYLAMVKHGTEWGRSVFLSTSKDFVNWTEPKLILHSDETDKENRRRRIEAVCSDPAYLSPPIVDDGDYIGEVYQMSVMPYEGIYVGLPVLFNPAGAVPPPRMNYTGINQVELATSRDLYSWTRVADREVFIPISPWDGVAYDTAQTLSCGRPLVRGDEIWVYYNALRFRSYADIHEEKYKDFFEDDGALNLAKLRLDGFVSLEAEQQGEVVTKPLLWSEGMLHTNADASGGELRAEVLDAETMFPLPGFTADKCVPFREDNLRGCLRWEGRNGAPGGPARIRFLLQRAQIYAFWAEP